MAKIAKAVLLAAGLGMMIQGVSLADEIKLIVRGDDLGMTQGSLIAFEKAFNAGVLTCGSVLVPAPWFIKIGIVDTYSGPAAVFGNDALNGFKLAVDEINKQGVLGGKIVFTTRDEQFKVDIGLNMAKELILKENVDVLVGTINSGASMAISEAVAKKEKVPFIVWTAKSENITGKAGHRYVFSTAENTAMAGKSAAVVFAQKPYKKFWIAGDDYEYGHAIADAVWRNLKKIKPEAEAIGKTWWKPGETDLIPYLTAIQAAKPDCIIFATGGVSMANVLKAIKATGMASGRCGATSSGFPSPSTGPWRISISLASSGPGFCR